MTQQMLPLSLDEVTGLWSLPKGWEWRTLIDVAFEDSRQVRPSNTPDAIFNYWSLDVVDKGQYQEPEPNFVLGKTVQSNCVSFDDEVVLYSKLRPYLNKVITPSISGIGTTEWIVIRPRDSMIDRKYLAYYLRTQHFIAYATKNSTGARMPRVIKSALWNAMIPIPYADEPSLSLRSQRATVVRIEQLLAELQEVYELHAAIDLDIAKLMRAIIDEGFAEGRDQGWDTKTIEDLIDSKPQYGTSEKASEEPIGTPIIRMSNIREGELILDDLKYVELSSKEERKFTLQKGDILFNRTNSAELVGKSAVFNGDENFVFASYLIRFSSRNKGHNPQFIVDYINSSFGRKYIQEQLTRAIGQVNLNATKLQSMPIFVPDSEIQNQFVAHLNAIRAEINEIRQIQTQDRLLLQQMEQSILEQAFRGEL